MDAVEASTQAGARYLELPYRIILTKEKRKGVDSWLALVEELPGCEAHGDTAEEATQALRQTMAAWISDALEEGRAVPRPRNSPRSTNGKLTLELPESLHEALAHTAVREGLTVDQLITVALAGAVRWHPGNGDAQSRWISSRARHLSLGNGGGAGLRRAILFNAVLLICVAIAAVAILAIAVAHGF